MINACIDIYSVLGQCQIFNTFFKYHTSLRTILFYMMKTICYMQKLMHDLCIDRFLTSFDLFDFGFEDL